MRTLAIVPAMAILIGACGGDRQTGGDHPEEASSVASPSDWAEPSGLMNFCDYFDSFEAKWVGSEPTSIEFFEDSRADWREIGFLDELVGDARNVDLQMEMLIDQLEGVDVNSPDFDAKIDAIYADPELGPVMVDGQTGFEAISGFYTAACG